jgi:hypothetical protein
MLSGNIVTEAPPETSSSDHAHCRRICRRVFDIAPAMLVPEQIAGR